MPISHSSFSDATKPRSEKAWRATEGNRLRLSGRSGASRGDRDASPFRARRVRAIGSFSSSSELRINVQMTCSIFEPMHFSQANHSENYQFLFLAERETCFFHSHPPTRGAGFDSFDSNPFLPGWSVSG
jgi:hypothetical protein